VSIFLFKSSLRNSRFLFDSSNLFQIITVKVSCRDNTTMIKIRRCFRYFLEFGLSVDFVLNFILDVSLFRKGFMNKVIGVYIF